MLLQVVCADALGVTTLLEPQSGAIRRVGVSRCVGESGVICSLSVGVLVDKAAGAVPQPVPPGRRRLRVHFCDDRAARYRRRLFVLVPCAFCGGVGGSLATVEDVTLRIKALARSALARLA